MSKAERIIPMVVQVTEGLVVPASQP